VSVKFGQDCLDRAGWFVVRTHGLPTSLKRAEGGRSFGPTLQSSLLYDPT